MPEIGEAGQARLSVARVLVVGAHLLKLARVDGEYRFQMSATQSQQFENFEKAEKSSN